MDARGQAGRRLLQRSRTRLALLALRYGEKLADSVIEPSELLDELRILLERLCELATKRRIFSSQ
jgi:hypothetical protein